jgi:hypothetical protein
VPDGSPPSKENRTETTRGLSCRSWLLLDLVRAKVEHGRQSMPDAIRGALSALCPAEVASVDPAVTEYIQHFLGSAWRRPAYYGSTEQIV